jgi:hypothetical protein
VAAPVFDLDSMLVLSVDDIAARVVGVMAP